MLHACSSGPAAVSSGSAGATGTDSASSDAGSGGSSDPSGAGASGNADAGGAGAAGRSQAGGAGADAGEAGAYSGTAGQAGVSGGGATEPAEDGYTLLVGVGSWGLRARSSDAASWSYCGNPSTGDDHSPDLLRAVGYGAGVFIAVGGDQNGMVMRSLDGEHWEEDVHPTSACPGETYPSSCKNWLGAVAYHDGVWLAGGGNGATMRSRDDGRSWRGLHQGFPEKHIRALGAGAGRFIAGTDGGGLYVTSDDGDSWSPKSVWSGAPSNAVLRIAYGNQVFVAYSETGDACFVSHDLGDSWQPCARAAQGGTSYVFDGERWIAALSDSYAVSMDALAWSVHPAQGFPHELLFDGTTWFGRSGSRYLRGSSLDDLRQVATSVSDFRALVLGRVLAKNLPVSSVAACTDRR